MSIYTIGDLHLSFNEPKPMDIFGDNWNNHEEKIKKYWENNVKGKDTVIIPGDFSWAMNLDGAKKDFEYLYNLPGKKILLKGNHEYWWTTVTKIKNFLHENNFDNIELLNNNSINIENKIICGTRGWNLQKDEELDRKVLKREEIRLELSIQDGIKNRNLDEEIIVFMHYPPITKQNLNTNFLEILKTYNIKRCYYAHLHGNSIQDAFQGTFQGIEFKLVSADALDFKLLKIE